MTNQRLERIKARAPHYVSDVFEMQVFDFVWMGDGHLSIHAMHSMADVHADESGVWVAFTYADPTPGDVKRMEFDWVEPDQPLDDVPIGFGPEDSIAEAIVDQLS